MQLFVLSILVLKHSLVLVPLLLRTDCRVLPVHTTNTKQRSSTSISNVYHLGNQVCVNSLAKPINDINGSIKWQREIEKAGLSVALVRLECCAV